MEYITYAYKDFDTLLTTGEQLFFQHADKLNYLSGRFLRDNAESFRRRKIDLKEIFLAMALVAQAGQKHV